MTKELRTNETNNTTHIYVMFNIGRMKVYKTINDCLFLLENNNQANHKELWQIEIELNQHKQFDMLLNYQDKLHKLIS